MIQIELLDLCVLLLCVGAFLVFRFLPQKSGLLHDIKAIQALDRGFQRAAEEGKRLHFSLGRGGLLFNEGAASLAGVAAMKAGIGAGTSGDCRPAVTCGDGGLAQLSAAAAAKSIGICSHSFDAGDDLLTGVSPASYALGSLDALSDTATCGNLLLGVTGSESALLAEAANRKGTLTLAGSSELAGQASLTVWSEHVLYGDLFFAIPGIVKSAADTRRDETEDTDVPLPPVYQASLRTQDFLRWTLVLAALAGILFRAATR